MRVGSVAPRRSALLDPRAHAARHVDVATRERLIARQRHPRRREHAMRAAVRALATTLAITVGLVAGGVAGAWGVRWVRTSPLFRVEGVEIVGADLVPEATIRAALPIAPGTSLFDIDPAVLETRLLATPGVRSAAVVRHLPNRLTVVMEERQPYALVHVSDPPGFRWVDATGRLVAKEGRGEILGRPVLSGVEPPPHADGGPLPDRLRQGLALLRALERAGGMVLARISEIDLRRADEPLLYTMEGVELRLGDPPWESRLARLDGLLAELQASGERVDWIDLRFRNQVVFKPRAVPPPGPASAPKAARASGSSAGDTGSDGRRP